MIGLKCTRSSSVTTATWVPCSWNTNAVDGIVCTCLSTGAVSIDLGVGAGPEGPVLVVDREDGDRGARAHIESTGDGQEFAGEMTIGQLRHRHVGRQARLEKGPERLRHGDKEAQHTDVGHRKEVADRTGTADRAFLIDVVTDVDVAHGHHAVIGRDDGFEPNQRLEVLDVLLRCLDLRRFGFRVCASCTEIDCSETAWFLRSATQRFAVMSARAYLARSASRSALACAYWASRAGALISARMSPFFTSAP